jgi:8-oxo-dGTP pyrophosphatase MutT (NUDIX family)
MNHFSAGVFFGKNPQDGKWYVLGATDSRFPTGVKIPGGTNKDENANFLLDEKPGNTLVREFIEETGLKPEGEFDKVHSVTLPARKLGETDHTRYFYLVRKVVGIFPFGSVKEFRDDKDDVKVRWWNLQDFEKAIFRFPNHKEGYVKAFLQMANLDEKFKQDNLEMFNRFSAIKF